MSRCRMIAVISMVVVVSMTGAAQGAEFWVHPDGNDCGWCGTEENPFRTIQHAIDECTSDNNDVIHVQDDPCEPDDYVTGPIHINYDKVELIFEQGVVVEANIGFGLLDCLFEAVYKSNIIFRGEGTGATLRMKKSEYTVGEWRHVISLKGCTNVKILGLTLKDSGGDGVRIGRGPGGKAYCEDILITRRAEFHGLARG